ncbi:hypothetical protein SAMD00023353_9800110 [Rosellinia necatrix]|uniref:Uncharacterized protein n=1 Tax=Rosellinia necatrix TaxID=77044 RepID=A0A1W2TUE2_ROSNE|nr:hypothetical protein SAMD00023353_9800110 [Rosellinia necatrix]
MSSPVSATTTSASASSSSTAAPVCSNLYVIPIAEAGCAVSFTDSHKDAMSECCKSADVISYSNDCGLYCAAAGQTIKELQDCLFGESVAYQDVFCNANQTATATNTNPALPPSASASVVSSGDGKDDDQDGNDGDDDDDGDDKPEPTDSGSAAPRLAPELSVSKAGLTIGALLFSAMAFGAFQI